MFQGISNHVDCYKFEILLRDLIQVVKMGTYSCWPIDLRFMLKESGNLFAPNVLTKNKQISFVPYWDTKKEQC